MSLFVTSSVSQTVFRTGDLSEKCRLYLVGDYHCTMDDERGIPFQQYSARMAQWEKSSMEALEQEFRKAQQKNADAVLLLGDILSFPSEAGAEHLEELMKNAPLPVYYTAGNHDWHYEGLPGSDMEQRSEWIGKRLKKLYRNEDPLNYALEIKGLKILMVDNSVYEITPSQLEFLEKELADGRKTLIACHIPFYLPEKDAPLRGCGSPHWCKANDPYFEIEGREPWPEEGFSRTTFDFCSKVLNSENVIGIVAGHIHTWSLDVFGNKFQLVTDSKQGSLLELE